MAIVVSGKCSLDKATVQNPPFPAPLSFVATHSSGGQHGGVVVDVGDRDDGGGRVGQAEVQVALHVRGLHDDGILGHFLWKVPEGKDEQCEVIVCQAAFTSSRLNSRSHILWFPGGEKRKAEPVLCCIVPVHGLMWEAELQGWSLSSG